MLKQSHDALSYLRQAVAAEPSSDVALSNLVYALLNLGHISEALTQTERVLAQHANSASGHLLRGFALTQQARIEEALESFQRSWEIDKASVDYIISDRSVSPVEHSAMYTEEILPGDIG